MKKIFFVSAMLFALSPLFAAAEMESKEYIGKDGTVSITVTASGTVAESESAEDETGVNKYIGRDGVVSRLLAPPPAKASDSAMDEQIDLSDIHKLAEKVLALAQKKAGTDFKEYTGAYNSSSINIMPPTIELKNGYVFTYMHDGDSSPERHDIECWGFAVGQGESYVPDKEMIKKVRLTGKIYGWKGLLSHIGLYGNYYAEEIEKVFCSEDKVKEYLSDYEKASDEIAEILKCFK